MTVKFDEALLVEHVRLSEKFEPYPYRCPAGKLTIGYGRNLEDNGIDLAEGELLLSNDLADAIADAKRLPYFDRLDPVRQMVICDMIFNLGAYRFGRFVKMHAALTLGDYTLAAHEMVNSKWFRQVGGRARKLVEAMRTGIWPSQ